MTPVSRCSKLGGRRFDVFNKCPPWGALPSRALNINIYVLQNYHWRSMKTRIVKQLEENASVDFHTTLPEHHVVYTTWALLLIAGMCCVYPSKPNERNREM